MSPFRGTNVATARGAPAPRFHAIQVFSFTYVCNSVEEMRRQPEGRPFQDFTRQEYFRTLKTVRATPPAPGEEGAGVGAKP